MPPPRVARAQFVERSSRREGGAGLLDWGWGNVLISPKHQPFAAAATFDIRSRIPTQTVPHVPVTRHVKTNLIFGHQKRHQSLPLRDVWQMFSLTYPPANTSPSTLLQEDVLAAFWFLVIFLWNCFLITLHVDVAGCNWRHYWANYIVDIDIDIELGTEILIDIKLHFLALKCCLQHGLYCIKKALGGVAKF